MDLELTTDQAALRQSVRDVLAAECPLEYVRGVGDGTADPTSLWKTMVDLGWPSLCVPEAWGGIGLGFVELCLVLEELGATLAPGPFVPTVAHFATAVAGLGTTSQQRRFLEPVASGALLGAVAMTRRGEPELRARRTADGWMVRGTARAVAGAPDADEIVAFVDTGAGRRAIVVPTTAASVRPVRVADETRSFGDVAFADAAVEAARALGEEADQSQATAGVVDRLTVAEAALGLGACRTIFETTLDYAKARQQFGVPIGSFQAIKHKLVDMHVALERARALITYAMAAIDQSSADAPLASAMAKAAYGDCQALLFQQSFQTHGGIAYTWDHPLHLFLKRAQTCDSLFGNGTEHQLRVGELLRAGTHLGQPA